jgi:N,N'-diacetyllegionaminate synthase
MNVDCEVENIFQNLNKALIIAEIGVNHNGDINLARQLIDAAKESGADAVKFQTFKASTLATIETEKVGYQLNTTSPDETHYEMLRSLELSYENHIDLLNYCKGVGIEFLSTPYDIESAKFLEEIGVNFFKTASADLIDIPLQTYIASTGKSAIVATGMATLGEIERVVNIYEEVGNSNVILLHAVSNYPCSDLSLNLLALKTLADAFSLPIGFSDHSEGFVAAIIAVAYGAKVIEKHFTLDKSMIGPDHRASSTPTEFSELVKGIRRAEVMMGSRRKTCQFEEQQMKLVSRKSVTLARAMKAGEVLKISDIHLLRPGNGLDPSFIPDLVGKVIRNNLEIGHRLEWSDVEVKHA